MTCSACVARVEKVVKRVVGVGEVNVNLLKNSMRATFDASRTNASAIITAVEQAGFGITIHQGKAASLEDKPVYEAVAEAEDMRRRLILSLAFSLPLISPVKKSPFVVFKPLADPLCS